MKRFVGKTPADAYICGMTAAEKVVTPIKTNRGVGAFLSMLDACNVIQKDITSRGWSHATLQMVFLVVVVASFGSGGCSVTAARDRLYNGNGNATTVRNVRASLLVLIKRGYVVRIGPSNGPRYVLSVYARDLLRPYL